jgi:lipoprotein-anchoring transpeptidase ErfK/SrfK
MRTALLGIVNLAVVVAVSASTVAAVGAGRESSFRTEAAALEAHWSTMQAQGVPETALQPLRTSLSASTYDAPWWSPTWWNDPGSAFLQSLDTRTAGVWEAAIAAARGQAGGALIGWDLMAERDAAFLPSGTAATVVRWQGMLAAATTPARIDTLTASLTAWTAAAEHTGIEQASALVAQVPANLRALELMTDQAGAEAVPGADGYLTTYRQVAGAVAAKPSASRLSVLAVEIQTLDTTVSDSLRSHACGHAVPAGKTIVINLDLQEVVFYQNGCALEAAPVSSGRRGERTPTGTFHVFRKVSPVLFTSWAGRGSPYWYPPERANYALEFTVVRAGIYLHDAPWEAAADFGPGSENTSAASHGCVHAPTSVMAWAYTWAPIGTPVIVTG